MRSFHSVLLPLVLVLVTSCAGQNSVESYRAEGGSVYPDLAYTKVDGDDVLLDIYLPNQPKTAMPPARRLYPVIIWIHGGGWRWGSKDSVPVLGLTKAGFALVSLDYRLDGHAKYPAQIDDCRAALAWLKLNGARYNLDISRLGLIGASAGGHLVALLGTTGDNFPALPKIKAVCALYPPTNLLTVVKESEHDAHIGLVPLLLGGSVNEKKDLAWAASPIRYVSSDDPPFFLIHGQLDTLVPIEQSITLNDALLKAGVSSQLKICPNEKHGFYPDSALTSEIVDFFHKYLGE